MKTICIIPARGGSKGIPDKNIIDFCGRPLLALSILQARNADLVDAVYVSSDSDRILEIALEHGALPIKRPEELSGDSATSESALLHALNQIRQQTEIGLVVFLQATSPLRESADIDGAIMQIKKSGADSLFSMSLLEDYCIWSKNEEVLDSITYDYKNRSRRQERKPLYLENGSIYVFKPEILEKYNNRLGGKIAMFEMKFWKSHEIDSFEDIENCQYYFDKYLR